MRLVLIFPHLLVWITWTYLSWKHQTMQDMPVTVAASLAATVVGKAVQAVAEKKQVATSESSTVTTKSESTPVDEK